MKTVIEMARQAGVRDDGHRFEFSEYKYFERFVELVRADAIAEEREACAKVCGQDEILDYDPVATADACAATIRARGKTSIRSNK